MLVRGIDVVALPDADYFGVDFRISLFGVVQILKYHNAGALAEDRTPGVGVERPASGRGIVVALAGGAFEKALADQDYRVDLGLGAARQGDIGGPTCYDLAYLGYRQMSGGFGAGDSIAGALDVVDYAYVTGEHVGQILEQP